MSDKMVAIGYKHKYTKSYINVLITILILILTCTIVSAADADYNFVVKENGETTSAIILNNPGNINIPLPLDANPSVKGALYVQASNGIDVQVGTIEGLIVYKSQYHTAKSGDWIFEAQISNNTNTVVLELPKNIEILTTSENAIISTSNNIRLTWQQPKDMIRVTYRFLEGTDNNNFAILYFLVILIIIIIGFFGIKRLRDPKENEKTQNSNIVKKSKQPREKNNEKINEEESNTQLSQEETNKQLSQEEPSQNKIVSDSQLNIMKTLSANEEKIMRVLMLETEIKRNKLERKTQLAKSSLAGALNNLEKKNIIRIDRSHTVHYISLTEWFKDL